MKRLDIQIAWVWLALQTLDMRFLFSLFKMSLCHGHSMCRSGILSLALHLLTFCFWFSGVVNWLRAYFVGPCGVHRWSLGPYSMMKGAQTFLRRLWVHCELLRKGKSWSLMQRCFSKECTTMWTLSLSNPEVSYGKDVSCHNCWVHQFLIL